MSRNHKFSLFLVFIFGIFASILEVYSLFFASELFSNLQRGPLLQEDLVRLGLSLFVFVGSIVFGLVAISYITRTAYLYAAAIVLSCIELTKRSTYNFADANLSRLLLIERDKLGREILGPLYGLAFKMSLPLVLAIVFVVQFGIQFIAIVSLFFLAYAVMSYFFMRIFRASARSISAMNESISKDFNSFEISLLERVSYSKLSLPTHTQDLITNSARAEGLINAVSQAPRSVLDILMLLGLVLLAFAFPDVLQKNLIGVVALAPLLSRSVSAIQATYKYLANILANSGTVYFVSSIKKQLSDPNLEPPSNDSSNSKLWFGFSEDDNLKIAFRPPNEPIGGWQTAESRVIGINGPSGVGKTTMVEHALGYYQHGFLQKFTMSFDGILVEQIGYVRATPGIIIEYDFEVVEFALKNSAEVAHIAHAIKVSFEQIALWRASAKMSTGERVRLSLLREVALGKRLIVVDEALSNIPFGDVGALFAAVDQTKFLQLIVISHSAEILNYANPVIKLSADSAVEIISSTEK